MDLKNNNLSEFSNQYQLSKTLRFELKPQGKTIEHIKKKGLISKDEARAKSYEKMKKTIDGFHKYFIEVAMAQVNLSFLDEFEQLYNAPTEEKKDDTYKKAFEKVQNNLRKEIVRGFKVGEAKDIFSKIDKKELITKLLEEWISKQQNDDIYFDEKFKTFTTYFGGFHENRKNMYTDKAHTTAIAYRLIHENLPKFIDNIKIFEKVKTVPEVYKNCSTLYTNIEAYLNINSIDEAFELAYYNEVLSQKEIDVYNLIIGGQTKEEGKKKIQGLNEYINLYNQKQEKKNRIPKLKPLYKQILSDRENISFLPELFEESQDVLDAIESYYKANLVDYKPDDKDDTENILKELYSLLKGVNSFDTNKIYIRNDKSLTDISKAIFGDWAIIDAALEFEYIQDITIPKSGLTKKQEKEKERYLKQPYFTIQEIEQALKAYRNENEVLADFTEGMVGNYFYSHFKTKTDSDKEFDFVSNIEAKYSCIKGVLNTKYPKNQKLNQDKVTVNNIKVFLDSLMELLHFIKPLALPNDVPFDKDETFYGHFETYYEQLQLLIPLYNKVRNYATQKAYSKEKFKLNFENSTLLDGWDVNKEEANSCVLFQKEGLYYLGIMDKNHNKVFRNLPSTSSKNTYNKINYKLLPGASKMLPKVFFSSKNIAYYNPDKEILRIRNHSTHTKGGSPQKGYEKQDFNVKDCRKMIDFFKTSIHKHPDWKKFGFEFSETAHYNSIDTFYREVESQGYTITHTAIDNDYIDKLVNEGKLYLFQIYNKDFSPYSKGKPNMHTLYWKALFEPDNLNDVVYKLNGQAEVFYRKKSIKEKHKVIHKAQEPIINKNPLAQKKTSVFDYDIIKDKRYTVDKFQFHVPITLNFKAVGNEYLNTNVLDYLRDNSDVKIIGLDRGERHLIYLSVIDQEGNILEQESLNTIINKEHNIHTPYHKLLDKREKERDSSRKEWGTIATIKELKEGYISQVVHRITQLMVKHNAIVVMEDLNFGFKRGRFKVEKQVYQKLEKMLIDKLNYLVFKDKLPNEAGGLYNALQLTN